MQHSINTGLPKHPHLTLMTSVKSSNVKGKLRKLTCWGLLKRWMTVETATSHTVNWKRPWQLWVAKGTHESNRLHTHTGSWFQSWLTYFRMFREALETLHHNIRWDLLNLSGRREDELWRSQGYFLIAWHQQGWKIELFRSKFMRTSNSVKIISQPLLNVCYKLVIIMIFTCDVTYN